jgi:hypothetical protein
MFSQCFTNILTLVFLRWSFLINIWNYRIIYTIWPKGVPLIAQEIFRNKVFYIKSFAAGNHTPWFKYWLVNALKTFWLLPCLDDQLLMHIGNYRRIYTMWASCSMTRITYICHFRPAVTLIPHTNIQKYGVLHKIRVCLHLYNMVQFIISQCFNSILTLIFLRWSIFNAFRELP